MDSLINLINVIAVVSILSIAAVVWMVRVLQRRGEVGVQSSVELTAQDGWYLLNLAVVNPDDTKVWVERVAFVLTHLDAEMQSRPASAHGFVQVREFVRTGEVLRVSLIEAVYNAAGKPQGAYTFQFSGAVRFRVGQHWQDSETPDYRVDMVRLSSLRLRRVQVSVEPKPTGAGALSPLALLDIAPRPFVEEPMTATSEDLKESLHSV